MSNVFDKLFEYYFKNYKKLLILPIISLILLSSSLVVNYVNTGNIVNMDISLTGGVSVNIKTNEEIDVLNLQKTFNYDEVRVIKDFTTGNINGIEILNKEGFNEKELLNYLRNQNHQISTEDLTIFEISGTLAKTFLQQSILILFISFILMSVVIYLYFRNWTSALSITVSTLSDVISLLAIMNILGLELGIASIGALLIIIGYSSDSDVLLATKIIKERKKPLKERMKQALKTELTQDLAGLCVFFIMAFFSNNQIIRDIGIVLFFGIIFDFFNTWIQNASLQRWFVYEKGGKIR